MVAPDSHRRESPLGFFQGAAAVFVGLRAIVGDRALRKLVAVPVALTTVLYFALIAAVVTLADNALAWVWARPEAAWLLPVWYVAWVAGMLAVFLIAALLFTTVAEIVGGTFYERMASRILTGYGVSVEQPGFVDGTILDALRSLIFVIPAAGCAVLGLIPGVGLPFALLGTVLAWLGFGSSAISPPLLVTGHRFGARLAYVGRHFFTVLGLGAVVALSMAIPLLPLLSIPCSIAGAAHLYGRGRLGGVDGSVDARTQTGLQSG